MQPIGRNLRQEPSVRLQQQAADIGIGDRSVLASGDKPVHGIDFVTFLDPRQIRSRPQTEQQDARVGKALAQFHEVGADTLGGEIGRAAMTEVVGADQQHRRARRRPIEIAVG